MQTKLLKSPYNNTSEHANNWYHQNQQSFSPALSSPNVQLNSSVSTNQLVNSTSSAVNYVNHAASINSGTLQTTPMANASDTSSNVECGYTNNQYTQPMQPTQQQPQYAVYPNYYYYQTQPANVVQGSSVLPQVDYNSAVSSSTTSNSSVS